MNTLVIDDCFNVFPSIQDKSVDLILCDLPYGITQNKWDCELDLEKLWIEYKRVLKPNGVVALFGSGVFTAKLIMSNLAMYKYRWCWNKVNRITGFLNAKKQPLRVVEDICIYYNKSGRYYPQMGEGKAYRVVSHGRKSSNYGIQTDSVETVSKGERYPKDLLTIKGNERGTVGLLHPTQKPLELLEYLIKTYTLEGELVLDNCAGSGSTLVAAKNLRRNYVGIEKDAKWEKVIRERLAQAGRD